MELLGQLAISVVGGAVAAVLTVWLSLRRFYREKWWERKMAAYVAIIEALHHERRSWQADWEEEVEGKKFSTDYRAMLSDRARDAWAELRKNMDIGEFLFSTEATEALTAYHAKVDAAGDDPHADAIERIEAGLAAVDELLPQIKKIAHRDLKLIGWFRL